MVSQNQTRVETTINLEKIKPQIRYLAEMKDLLFDQAWVQTAPDLKLYFMYRDLAKNKQDQTKIKKAGLRYDITIMPFLMLGREFNKTAGHDHPLVPKTNLTYPEIYQVLKGRAIFLIQDSQADAILDIYTVQAKENDKVIVPPNYEHLMINASGKELKTANWMAQTESNIYKPFRQKRGFGYYALVGPNGDIIWHKSPNYQDVPELKFLPANRLLEKFKIEKDQDIYTLAKDLKKLNFLKNPQKYEWK
ncbi:MAG: glucose-6-phosphate isomerase family protein [Patescibacteria group bacterium]